MQTQASREEHIQSALESKIQTLLVNEREQNKAEIFALSNKLNKLEDENDDLRNRSMRSTLIFRGIPEEEQNYSWENVTKHFVNTLVKKLRLDYYELDLQINRAHRTPANESESVCRPIFAQFVNWRYADDVRRRLIKLHAAKQSNISVTQMFTKRLTTRRNEALKRRKELLEEDPTLQIYREYPAKLMGKKRNTKGKYRVIEIFEEVFLLLRKSISCVCPAFLAGGGLLIFVVGMNHDYGIYALYASFLVIFRLDAVHIQRMILRRCTYQNL